MPNKPKNLTQIIEERKADIIERKQEKTAYAAAQVFKEKTKIEIRKRKFIEVVDNASHISQEDRKNLKENFLKIMSGTKEQP